MHFGSPAEMFGMDGIVVLAVLVLVLFGSPQIPKLARSLGSAQIEFKKGVDLGGSRGSGDTEATEATEVAVPAQHDVGVSRPKSTVRPTES
jgi:TatA/E family protein of Tat protein translocase